MKIMRQRNYGGYDRRSKIYYAPDQNFGRQVYGRGSLYGDTNTSKLKRKNAGILSKVISSASSLGEALGLTVSQENKYLNAQLSSRNKYNQVLQKNRQRQEELALQRTQADSEDEDGGAADDKSVGNDGDDSSHLDGPKDANSQNESQIIKDFNA